MIYLPGACERCSNLFLVSSEHCIGGKALCGSCGGLVAILPGGAYCELDISLFNELSELVAGVSLCGIEAQQLALALDEASLTLDDEQVLGVAAFWLPPLDALAALLAASPVRSRQACAMLRTILHCRARKRVSGFMVKQDATEAARTSSPSGKGGA